MTILQKPFIQFRNITKKYGAIKAVDSVTLDIYEQEFFCLLGPSGCGKTTLMRMLAGFEVPTEGQILLDGMDVSNIPPNKRPINMVFQSYAVFPHMTVFDNVAYGLKVTGAAKADIHTKVTEALSLVQLSGFEDRKPDQMSGGQRQRVALARALVKKPKVLLLDEPLSALDAKLRDQMRLELVKLQEQVGITFIMVTHDQDEALSMASRIAVINKGVVAQISTPRDLYEQPSSRFVADFIGSVNVFEGKLHIDEPSHAAVVTPDMPGPIYMDHGVTGPEDGQVWAAIRPEKIMIEKAAETNTKAPDAPEGHNTATGTIQAIAYLGDLSLYEVRLDSGKIIKVTRPNLGRWDAQDLTWDDKVSMTWEACSPVVLLS